MSLNDRLLNPPPGSKPRRESEVVHLAMAETGKMSHRKIAKGAGIGDTVRRAVRDA